MITVDQALAHIFDLVAPLPTETVPLRLAAGRQARGKILARRTQPPFAAAAMDGYAVADHDVQPGAEFTIIGESAAGHGFVGRVGTGQAVRIFTGAPVPEGGARVVIQEDVERHDDRVTLRGNVDRKRHIRAAGQDFTQGDGISFDRALRPVDLALIAAMGHGTVSVTRRPEVAIIATGDELVAPSESPGPDQIVASNNLGLAAMVEQAGGIARVLPIARDTEASLQATFDLAQGSDLIVTIGGASVGDHDLVAATACSRGMKRSFYKVAMRPGKPLMAGRIGGTPMIGLPGNPVSSMVCGEIFIKPALAVLLGKKPRGRTLSRAVLAHDIPANGSRAHYMRAVLDSGRITICDRQDSALLSVLAHANALAVRPPNDPARHAGSGIDYLAI